MPLISKCHFEDLFKQTLEEIEEQFDIDFRLGIFYDLKGLVYEEIMESMKWHNTEITGELFDHLVLLKTTPTLEPLIKDFIVKLLYLLKMVKEDNKNVTNT